MLVVLGVGYLAARLKPRGWRYVHLNSCVMPTNGDARILSPANLVNRVAMR